MRGHLTLNLSRPILLMTLAVASACRPGPRSIAPPNMPLVSDAMLDEWIAELAPSEPVRYDLRWQYTTQRGSARGRAAVIIGPPDSLRFDYRGPFGRSGAAVVFGNTVEWSEPEDDAGRFVEEAALFWAALGIPQRPREGATVRGQDLEGRRIWQYQSPLDTLTYIVARESPLRLEADLRRANRVVGFVEVTYGDSMSGPVEAVMTFPQDATTFRFTIRGLEALEAVDPEIWKRP